MPLLASLYTLSIPIILLCSIPLAFLATLTTIIAFSILAFRVLLVYAELAFTIIPYYLALSLQPSSPSAKLSPQRQARDLSSSSPTKSGSSSSSTILGPRRRSKRRSSSTSIESLTPVASTTSISTSSPNTSTIALPISQSVGPQRDYEGVGGWRLDPPSDDDKPWSSIPRLELPADHARRHRRSLTGGGFPVEMRRNDRSWSPEFVMAGTISPNTSRARTPPTRVEGGEGYFAAMSGATSSNGSPKNLKKVVTGASGSPGSVRSSASSGLNMKGRM